ncbi:MAG: diaminopimelate epimerase, partial [Clostridia bacterium]|nr:diaminopimelate epimerase [Clostridia bacterium]
TTGTAQAISTLGIDVISVKNAGESDDIPRLMAEGDLSYIVYTGAVKDATIGDYTVLHRKAMLLGIPCLTSLDTANALANIIESRFNEGNTELVDINAMRAWRQKIHFAKMQSCGNDCIFVENFDGAITCPESLCVELCRLHYGIGGDGIVLIEKSRVADVRMRYFNRDGSEGRMAGNNLRCVAKYVYDKGFVRAQVMSVETASGIYHLRLYLRDGKVTTVSADMGRAVFASSAVPVTLDAAEVIDMPATLAGESVNITCVNVGNPHCVIFMDAIDALDISDLGPKYEFAPIFPERANIEWVRVINRSALRLRVWERGSGETLACGTGACAAAAAAVRLGLCDEGRDINVKLPGGDLTVNVKNDRITLTGNAVMVFEGEFEY